MFEPLRLPQAQPSEPVSYLLFTPLLSSHSHAAERERKFALFTEIHCCRIFAVARQNACAPQLINPLLLSSISLFTRRAHFFHSNLNDCSFS